MKNEMFTQRLLAWYGREKRDLPWRETSDPYRIWVSEVILQQTRVIQGLPYYHRFIDCFPDVKALAQAPADEVLRLWQGLGYYSRARNMHHAAKEVANDLGGSFPQTRDGLLQLKGIGRYTAAAVASFAFGEQVAVVDGNVYRVLARVFGIHEDVASGAGQKTFAELAQTVLPEQNSSEYNQAIMEFGALQCVPSAPDCETCPMRGICTAFQTGKVADLPVKLKKIKVRERYFNYLVIRCDDSLVMGKRSEGDIWQGLYEFPLLETARPSSGVEVAAHFHLSDDLIETVSAPVKHVLTHQRIFAQFYLTEICDKRTIEEIMRDERFRPYDRNLIDALPKPRLVTRFLELHRIL